MFTKYIKVLFYIDDYLIQNTLIISKPTHNLKIYIKWKEPYDNACSVQDHQNSSNKRKNK